jgi:hypothetical protein
LKWPGKPLRTSHELSKRDQTMAQRGRKKADQLLLMALACGATVDAAARSAAISPATAYRRLQDPEFCKQLQQILTDMLQRTSNMMTASGMESAKTLLELQKPTVPFAVRLGAARSMLELGMKVRERADLEERLAALEQQAEMNKPNH